MNKKIRNIAAVAFLTLVGTAATAQVAQQKVGGNPMTINQNAALEVESTNKGLLLPRLELTATNDPSPLTAHVAGMSVYNTATAGTDETAVTPGFYYNDGTQWVRGPRGLQGEVGPQGPQGEAGPSTPQTIEHDLTSSANVMTSTINGVSENANIINSNALTFDASTNVLTSRVNGVGATVDLSALQGVVPEEPWRVFGGTTEATSPSENMYVTGRVAIGADNIPNITAGATTIEPKFHVVGDVSITGKYYTTNSVYADYVFEKYFDGASNIFADYEFKSLDEVAAFIKENKHLPGVTPISDLQKSDAGYTVDLTNLSVELLEKTEELFLHTIEQQEQIEAQQKALLELTERLERLEKLMSDK